MNKGHKNNTTGNNPDHIAISASAGSGKTFQLAHRYIRLLADHVSPDRISALTFSRMAAGEIFESIVKNLANSASCVNNADKTAKLIGKSGMNKDAFLSLLRIFVDNMHRMHIGTLDSFIVGVARAFPTELGIPADFQMFDDSNKGANDMKQEVLNVILDSRFANKNDQNRFLEAFQLATFGAGEKNSNTLINEFIDTLRQPFIELPDENAWGNEKRIWPDNSPLSAKMQQPGNATKKLISWLDSAPYPKQMIASLNKIIRFAGGYDEYSRWDNNMDTNTVFDRLLAHMEDLKNGSAIVSYRKREFSITGNEGRILYQLLNHIMGIELNRSVQQSRGLFRILAQYEALYSMMTRLTGKLTFTDAQHLLTRSSPYGTGNVLSRLPQAEGRLYIDYRLDCQLDHWLLDEFQDTSNLQWAVLHNLVDEIMQDNSGQRSFFYVGDIKQAIYRWRGGNHRLFSNVLNKYPTLIKQIPLNRSYRSCQPVIDTVNLVFEDLTGTGLPTGAIDEWQEAWRKHQIEPDHVPEDGYATLIEPIPTDENKKPNNIDRYKAVASILREIDPTERKLSTAVLVRGNDAGKEAVDVLRRECPGMPVVHEGKAAIKDNPVVQSMLSLIKYAAHPGDMFAWRHLQMSPLKQCVINAGLDRKALPKALLKEIQLRGWQEFIRNWGARLDNCARLDEFGRKRLADLVAAASEFDMTGNPDCNAFLRFIDNYDTHDLAAHNAIRVMTIHQAKGLGFDIVILPDLMDKKQNMTKSTPEIIISPDGTSSWALKMPRRIIAEYDPVLSTKLLKADQESCFDELCVLYVAMTRAKHALYMVTSYPGDNAKTITPATLLKLRLCGATKDLKGSTTSIGGSDYTKAYETGTREWFKNIPAVDQADRLGRETAVLTAGFPAKPSTRKRLEHIEPSQTENFEGNASLLFKAESGKIRDFGLAVHALFEQVEWIENADMEKIIQDWQNASHDSADVKKDACRQFVNSINTPEVISALSKPLLKNGSVELWREKKFELIKDGKLISGTFDRVTIIRNSAGKSVSAVILDYKSVIVSTEEQMTQRTVRHRSQMSIYRDALSQILQLPKSEISVQILFTRTGAVRPVMF